ncbi:hypothetical protein ABPG74_004412 [Tetrahymena malaccensis]
MSDSSSNNNNQDSQSVEFIDKIGDHNINSFASPDVLIKNNYLEDNYQQNVIEEFSQGNNVDSRNDSVNKVDIQSPQQDSSSEPHKIYRQQSQDSQMIAENIQQGDVKSNEQHDEEDENNDQKSIQIVQNNDNQSELQQEVSSSKETNQQPEQDNINQIREDFQQQSQNEKENTQEQQISNKEQEQNQNQQLEENSHENNQIQEKIAKEEIPKQAQSENSHQISQDIDQGKVAPNQVDNQEKIEEEKQNQPAPLDKQADSNVGVQQNVSQIQQELQASNNQQDQKQNTQQQIQVNQISQSVQQGDTYSAQRQYEYMMEMQKRQAEFQRQMEELNQKYQINFRKIIDVKQESLLGNYVAGLLAIKMKYKSIDSRDQYGMTLLHNAVLGNEKELVIFLLNNGADVNLQDASQRTALMMAAHGGASQKAQSETVDLKKKFDEDSEEVRRVLKLHSFNKIFKILIDKGACFATKDAFKFSALLYSVQSQNLHILFYLIYLGANLRDSDMNGSSVVHWNAYKGNRFLMEVFHSLNLDMFTADNQGFTPFERSLMGISYETVDYLARIKLPEHLPDPDELESDGTYKIPSLSIRHNLKSIKTYKGKWYNRLFAWWKEQCLRGEESGIHPATYFFLLTAGILFYSAFISIYKQRNYELQQDLQISSFSFFYNIIFFIFNFIYLAFSIRFCNMMVSYKNRNKGTYVLDDDAIDRQNQLNLEEQRIIPPYMTRIMSDRQQFERIIQRMNFKHVDRILQDSPQYKATVNQEEELNRTTVTDHGDEEARVGLTQKSSYSHLSFIHQIAILFENNYFTSLGEVDYKRLCGSCLKYKPEKTKHCTICKVCVPYYQFHSILFNTCICAENHFLYLLHIFSLWISLFMFVVVQNTNISPMLQSWLVFKYIEIPYHIWSKLGIFHSLIYLGVLFSLFYISIYCSIEILGIFEDKTRDEILNPFEYSYNFEVIADKNRNLVKVLKGRTTGRIEYLKVTLKSFYYRTFVHLRSKR